MLQVVQELRSGKTGVRELPDPLPSPGHLVVRAAASVISAGTERYVVDLARKSLLGKAWARPDQVRRVLEKVRQEGVADTARQVFAKLEEPLSLGYSSAGTVLECGAFVDDLKPGDRVAMAAPHAGVVLVGKNQCVALPEQVSFEQAAYAGVAAIALEGIRLARVQLGDRVLVIGLGLLGQIAVGLLKAQGCRVLGTDIDPARLALARTLGADRVELGAPRDAALAFSDGLGVDAALITAATDSNEPIEFAADACRVRGRIVLVGVAGLNVPRPPFFQKELEFTVSSSLGPGRGDPAYEEKGVDYPIGYARWTMRRNLQAVVETIAAGRLPVERLTSHRFPIARAAEAYDLIATRREPFLAVLLDYPATGSRRVRLDLSARAAEGRLGVGVVGVGNFARLVLLPLLGREKQLELRGVCSARGMNAEHAARRYGFAFAATDTQAVLDDPATRIVFLLTRHDLHAEQVIAALRRGKHVFVEKPLCIRKEELDAIRSCVMELGSACPILMVGFNRRFAPATARLRAHFAGVAPLSVSFRFAPGALPREAWPHDEEIGGGRLVGEACHAIDTCTALVDSPPIRVHAESVRKGGAADTSDDRVFVTLRHEDGSVSAVSYQAGGDRAGPAERIEIFGGGRSAVLEGWDQGELWQEGRRSRIRGGKDKGHAAEIERFISACRNGGNWPIPWRQLHAVSLASLMGVESLRRGAPVDLDACAE